MSSRRSSIKWLLTQIPEWEAMGWVSTQGADSIREKYADEDDDDDE